MNHDLVKNRTKVAMVNYSNTRPFLLGFNKLAVSDDFELKLLTPADCAKAFDNEDVDVALVPSAFLLKAKNFKLISNYCIGSDGPVNSVALLSNTPIEQINCVNVDHHSMTSNRLLKILMREYWTKTDIQYGSEMFEKDQPIEKGTAYVMIGDKVFKNQVHFSYKYDLGEIWKNWTGLPFVFAVWISKPGLSLAKEELLNSVLSFGVNRIEEILQTLNSPLVNYEEYFKKNLKYHLAPEFKLGLEKYLDFVDSPSLLIS